jgi:polyisoprenoid-binding protein YceI/ribosomal protein S11
MKKSISILLVTMSVVALIVVNCKKSSSDTVVTAFKISGTVTGPTATGGAIVTLSTQPNAAQIVTRVVADNDGKYSITGLSAGTYYLSAKYNTDNTNLKSSGITFTTAGDLTVVVGAADVTQDVALVSNGSSGTDIIEYAASGKWNLDETHSRVGFEFPFDSVNATFTGHFANFGINSFYFDQATPANSHMDVWVDITSTETGAPTIIDTVNKKTLVGGRDGLNGCISHTFGVIYALADTFYKNIYRPTAVLSGGSLVTSAKASFVSTSVAPYGDGYVANGNLTFHALTKTVSLYFHYIKGYSATANGKTTTYSSFSGFFDMKAKPDFGIVSGHVKNNPVHVITNLQFNK